MTEQMGCNMFRFAFGVRVFDFTSFPDIGNNMVYLDQTDRGFVSVLP